MKKNYIYILLLVLVVGILGFTVLRYNSKKGNPALYGLKDRQGPSARTVEWNNTRAQSNELVNKIRLNPADEKSNLALAAIFIQEARVTGDHVYYDKAAMHYVNNVLAKDSNNFEGLLYKSLLLLSQHHFSEGLVVAEKAQKLNPYNAFVYGILVDGNIEMGNYAAAVDNSDKMVSIRPDIRSYSRISYLREIHGDYPGAIEAMKMAVGAGVPGEEASEWSRIQLGKLYEQVGDLSQAELQYSIALEQRPYYAYALAGLSRIAKSKKDYNKAIAFLKQADSVVVDYGFRESLADIYELQNNQTEARKLRENVIKQMSEHVELGMKNEDVGHYADLELAQAYLKMGKLDLALQHAQAEYNRRPNNIDVNETLAWVHYNRKEYGKAKEFIQVARKTNSKNPVLLSRVELIEKKG